MKENFIDKRKLNKRKIYFEDMLFLFFSNKNNILKLNFFSKTMYNGSNKGKQD